LEEETMKKLLAVLLALAMMVSCVALVACNNTEDETQGGSEQESGTQAPVTDETFEVIGAYSDPTVYTTFNGGEITTTLAGGASGGSINKVAFAGDADKDYRSEGYYTYNDFMGGTTGLNWNPHTWETNDDSYVLGYLSMGFYDFVLNEDLTGYAIIPEMAADYPVDVTADYVGSFGVKEGESGKAWKITLNPNATWDDGTAITADDYIYSMQQQLNSKMLNRRADSYYAGDFVIVGAKGYLYSGKDSVEDNSSTEKYTRADLVKGDDGVYTTANGEPIVIATNSGLAWLNGNSLAAYVNAYGEAYFGMDAWAGLTALADDKGNVVVTDESLALIEGVITAVADWGETADDVVNYMTYTASNPVVSWEEVGCLKTGDYEIVLIVETPIEEPEFYVPYNLSSNWIVKKDVYEASKKFFDAEGNEVAADGDNVTSITSTYCSSVENSVSYGPYKLTYFEADKQLTFERNDNWYGYSDGKHYGQFQTDKISCQVIAEHKTALQAFLAGDIDGVGLDSDDMTVYASSDRIRYTPESYTTKITFNTDYEKLVALGNNAQILAIKELHRHLLFVLTDRTL
jgi:ABC-type transport system substrate-binding protein